jgi:AcrR family transcriptional regulator
MIKPQSPPNTRVRILQGCLRLFNERGVAEVSSKDMSDALGISQGNLAYHFPRKADIVLALFAEREARIAELFERIRQHYLQSRLQPFAGMFDQLTELFGIVHSYRFVSIDLGYLARKHPEIGATWKRENNTMALVAERLFQLAVEDGYLEPERQPGAFARQIHRMQVLLNFSVLDQMARRDQSAYVTLLLDDLAIGMTPAGRKLVGEWLPALAAEPVMEYDSDPATAHDDPSPENL